MKEKQNLYQQIKSQIEEDGLAEAAIDYVLTVFCSAIDWEMEIVKETTGSNGSSYEERETSSGAYRSDGSAGFKRCQRQVRLIVPEERWGQQQMLILCL